MLKKTFFISVLSLTFFCCSKNDTTEEENPNICEEGMNFSHEVLKTINSLELVEIIKTNDGGYIGLHHAEDFIIHKFDQNFSIVWEKTFSGSDIDRAQSIIQTNDNGFIVAGYSRSNDGDFDQNYGDYDIWILKLNPLGDLEWKKNYGGNSADGLSGKRSVVENENGKLTITGYTKSKFEGSEYKGGYDALLFQVTSEGELVFRKTYGGTKNDFGRELIINNSNYNVLLKYGSSDGSFNKEGNWILNSDDEGKIVWNTFLGGINSGSLTIDSSNNIISANTNFYELLLHKINLNGEIIDTKTINSLGSTKQYSINDIIVDQEGNISVVGDLGLGNDQDAFIMNLCTSFEQKFDKTFGGNDYDKIRSILPLRDGYLLTFNTFSNNLEGVNNNNTMSTFFWKIIKPN
ncbi:hypothetical protein SAMN04488034_102542 [Salinimicrobium catena]|uniref:Bulb-type lectin domain-containing protein n=1 Tax=Salinimicrobium catena TaxID=390640 RepID=A0A1H5M3Q7_9FLAO|nr:hypothetical protein [Salinimicrobium catena]SDL18100.1 hypothetical protein SAMN04488140_102542 [Salinimicrobium catena]SEE83885.1 hypothetical protein SAMN04488034_102542 [Salinimicrobium catena]